MLMEKRSSECTTTQDKNNFYYWNDKNCHYLKWENNDIINQHYKPEPHARLPPPPAPLQNQSNHSVETRKQPLYKRILIVDDDIDITLTFKSSIEEYYDDKRFEVYTYNNPLVALSEFKPNFYDLLLTDINMPDMNGFELCQKILELDVDVRVCFISAGEANIEALREVYPNVSMGCFIKKPVSIEYLVKRLSAELD
jgi:CheY-like chemotaxis protein